MREIKYTLWNPSGNITALVETEIEKGKYREIAEKIMKKEPSCEQVGFLGENELCMAGNEFCGNASMCAAAYFFSTHAEPECSRAKCEFLSSGCDEPICADVLSQNDGFNVTLTMAQYKAVFNHRFDCGSSVLNLPVVDFGGIMHIIAENTRFDKSTAERYIKQWCDELGAKSLGLMIFDSERAVLTPLVFVKAVDTLFWESSCASGTAAVGVYVARERNKAVKLTLKEPCGDITVESEPNGKTMLSGSVKIEKNGSVLL